MKKYLYLKTHCITGKKYIGQTVRNPYKYKGSGVLWNEHLMEFGNFVDTVILYESTDMNEFSEVAYRYSIEFDVVNNPEFLNMIHEDGNNLAGDCNPNYKDGKFVGRLSDEKLYKKLDQDKFKTRWSDDNKKERDKARMRFSYYKKTGNLTMAEYEWNKWYALSEFVDNNRKSLWKTDTFEMWYNRQGNDLDFRNEE